MFYLRVSSQRYLLSLKLAFDGDSALPYKQNSIQIGQTVHPWEGQWPEEI